MLLNTMIKRFVPAKVMHGSREGDGTYFSFSGPGDHIYFQPEALLLPGAECLNRVACKVGPPVDVTGEWRIEEQTWMRRISLVYPGEGGGEEGGETGISTLFPIGDLVLQHRGDIGRSSYAVSHIMVGIPVDTYMAIWNGVNRQLKQEVDQEWQDKAAVHQHGQGPTSFSVHEAPPHDGHYWLDATLQRSLKGAVANPDGTVNAVDVTAEMLSTGASFKCDAAAGFRLVKKWHGEWSLRMTLWTVHLKDADRELDDRYPESFGKGRISGYAPPRIGSGGRLGDPL